MEAEEKKKDDVEDMITEKVRRDFSVSQNRKTNR